MNINESEVANRYYSRFGDDPSQEQLDAIPRSLWSFLTKARSHADKQDAFDAILDFIEPDAFATRKVD